MMNFGKEAQKGPETTAPQTPQDLEKKREELAQKLEQVLRDCEGDLLKMSLVEEKGGKLKDYEFYTPVFRFIWTKVAKALEDLKKSSGEKES